MPNTRTTYTTSINWKVRCEAVEAENDKLKALVDAQEAYIRLPFTQEASHMAHAKKALAALLEGNGCKNGGERDGKG